MLRSEIQRLNAVKRFDNFEFDLNTNLQDILKLAADIYETPAAFITLIDEHTQWFKVNRGFEVSRMPRETSFCAHTIMQADTMVVEDTQKDTRFSDNPFTYNEPNIRFYAGASLTANDGDNIGTLCVMDVVPKEIQENKKRQLEILAKQAIYLMELELTYKLLSEKMQQIEVQNKALLEIAFVQSHDFRSPLASIMGLMNIIKEEKYESPKQYLIMMEEAVKKLDEKIHVVVKSTEVAKNAYMPLRS
jgi:GAF domain-containing protein